jgi:hypothetical protein
MQLAKDHNQQQTVVLMMLNVRKSHNKGITWIADGWTTNDLEFVWKDGDPVQVVKNLHLPRFTLEKFRTDSCNSKTNTGTCKWPSLCVAFSMC